MTFEQARFNMIEQQIRPWDVLDQSVLDLLANHRRDLFVSDEFTHLAYADTSLPIGHEQTMMPPVIEARMLQALEIQPADTILEIGTGSGYITQLLASLGEQVTSEEIFADLSAMAQNILSDQKVENVQFRTTNSLQDRDIYERYDVIAITGSLPEIMPVFKQQLTIGGRLFIVIGRTPSMEALLITRTSERQWSEQALFETDLPALIGTETRPPFSF